MQRRSLQGMREVVFGRRWRGCGRRMRVLQRCVYGWTSLLSSARTAGKSFCPETGVLRGRHRRRLHWRRWPAARRQRRSPPRAHQGFVHRRRKSGAALFAPQPVRAKALCRMARKTRQPQGAQAVAQPLQRQAVVQKIKTNLCHGFGREHVWRREIWANSPHYFPSAFFYTSWVRFKLLVLISRGDAEARRRVRLVFVCLPMLCLRHLI